VANTRLTHYHRQAAIPGEQLLSATELGAFDEGEDTSYFQNLKAFMEIIVNTVLHEHFDYDSAVPADVDLFMNVFNRGRIGGK
jgi:hypothetical protein